MNKPGSLISVIFVFALMAGVSYGQPDNRVQVEPSYEVSLHLLIGSNEAGQTGKTPPNFSAISQQLKSNFAYSNYRLGETLLGRMGNAGSLELKGGTNIGRDVVSLPQSFLDLSIGGLRSGQSTKGTSGFQIQTIRLSARVPVPTSVVKDDAGKERTIVNYEQIGLTLSKVGLPENVPTLIGTLKMPGAGDTIFLVMTVKSAEM